MTSRLPSPPFFLPAMLAGLLASGCILEENGHACLCPPAAVPIIPLATGNTWDYRDSVVIATPGGDSLAFDSLRVSITGTREVILPEGRRTVFLWNVHDRATGLPGALQLRVLNRADGNHTVGAEEGNTAFLLAADEPTLHVRHPAATGERYPALFLAFRDSAGQRVPVRDTVEIEVAHADTTCTVPAGTFACVHYRGRRNGEVFADSWYAPGIGWLGARTIRTDSTDAGTRTLTTHRVLRAYTLPRKAGHPKDPS